MRDEILAAASIGTGQCHAECAAFIPSRIHLVADCVSGSAVAIITRIAILRDEVRHDTVETRAHVKAGSSEVHEVPDSDWSVRAEQLEHDVATPGFYRCTLCLSAESWNDDSSHDVLVP